jgi:hypothetical protein
LYRNQYFSLAAYLCHWSIISGVHLSLDAASGHSLEKIIQ